jgi:hypothetical protein
MNAHKDVQDMINAVKKIIQLNEGLTMIKFHHMMISYQMQEKLGQFEMIENLNGYFGLNLVGLIGVQF